MALVTVTVDPDDVGADYSSLNTAESNEQTDLDTANDYMEIECTAISGTADSVDTSFAGWVTSAEDYVEIQTPEASRHLGYLDTDKYRLTGYLRLYEDVRVVGVQFASDELSAIDVLNDNTGEVHINDCLILGTSSNYNYGIRLGQTAAATCYIYNNIIYDFTGSESTSIRSGTANSTAYCYNNTIVDCTYGINVASGSFTAKNNIVMGGNTNFSYIGSFESASTHNIHDNSSDLDALAFGETFVQGTTIGESTNKLIDTSEDFTNVVIGMIVKNTEVEGYAYVTAVDSTTQLSLSADIMGDAEYYKIYYNMYGAVTFQNEGNNEFLLGSSDTVAKDKGIDLSEDPYLPFDTDILGTTRI